MPPPSPPIQSRRSILPPIWIGLTRDQPILKEANFFWNICDPRQEMYLILYIHVEVLEIDLGSLKYLLIVPWSIGKGRNIFAPLLDVNCFFCSQIPQEQEQFVLKERSKSAWKLKPYSTKYLTSIFSLGPWGHLLLVNQTIKLTNIIYALNLVI